MYFINKYINYIFRKKSICEVLNLIKSINNIIILSSIKIKKLILTIYQMKMNNEM